MDVEFFSPNMIIFESENHEDYAKEKTPLLSIFSPPNLEIAVKNVSKIKIKVTHRLMINLASVIVH